MVTKRKLLAYTLLTVGVIGALFFNNNVNIIPFTLAYQVLSVLMGIFGLILIFTIPSDNKLREQQQLKLLIDTLKTNGATLKVDLTRCTILENSYTESHNANRMLDVVASGDLKNILPDDDTAVTDVTTKTKLENVTLSILVHEAEIGGVKQKFFSQVINKDRATLMFLLEAQKQTLLYYDKNNPSRCYFVLDFLYN